MTFDDDNRLMTYNSQAVSFDSDGNMLAGPLPDTVGMSGFTYDARNRLSEGGGISYTYGPDGKRTSWTGYDGIRSFVNDPSAALDRVLFGDLNCGISLNRFAFANGNPVSLTDPFGLCASNGDWLQPITDTVNYIYPWSPHNYYQDLASGFGQLYSFVYGGVADTTSQIDQWAQPITGATHLSDFLTARSPVAAVESLGLSAMTGTTVVSTETTSNALAPSLFNLNRQLAAQEAASAFNDTGELSQGALNSAKQIFAPGELGNPQIPAGFGKFTTRIFQSPSGPFQVHFYQSPSTGKVFYGLDYKAVFNSGAIGQ